MDWVQATRTVLIVDVEKLMGGYEDAYTYMDDYLKFAGVSRKIEGGFTLNLDYKTAMGEVPVNMTGTISGAENADAAELSGSVKTDITALQAAILSHKMAMRGLTFARGEGLVMDCPEDTIKAVGYVGRAGMKQTDVEILNLMIGKTKLEDIDK